MLGSLNELIHRDIVEELTDDRRAIPWDYILSYDIDYDITKIRFWKDHEGVRVSWRYRMPAFANRRELWDWIDETTKDFKDMTITEETRVENEYADHKGYVKS